MAKGTDFPVGTIVKLKSGGPDMTVKEHIHNLNKQPMFNFRCQWFAGKKLEDGVFLSDFLEVVPPQPKAP